MADAYPVAFNVTRPEKFERPQVFIRLIALFFLGILGYGAFLLVPLLNAIWISQKGSERFLKEDGPKLKSWATFITALYSYAYLLTDKFPSTEEPGIQYDVQISGSPTLGSALLRWITSIPILIFAAILGWVAGVIWFIGSVMILLQETYPEGLYDFQRGVMRVYGRLIAYHFSLTDQYPPFAFDTGEEAAATA